MFESPRSTPFWPFAFWYMWYFLLKVLLKEKIVYIYCSELICFFLDTAMQELQDRAAKAKVSKEELMKVGREIVDFHGEMVLLENYSALNYTGNIFANFYKLILLMNDRNSLTGSSLCYDRSKSFITTMGESSSLYFYLP